MDPNTNYEESRPLALIYGLYLLHEKNGDMDKFIPDLEIALERDEIQARHLYAFLNRFDMDYHLWIRPPIKGGNGHHSLWMHPNVISWLAEHTIELVTGGDILRIVQYHVPPLEKTREKIADVLDVNDIASKYIISFLDADLHESYLRKKEFGRFLYDIDCENELSMCIFDERLDEIHNFSNISLLSQTLVVLKKADSKYAHIISVVSDVLDQAMSEREEEGRKYVYMLAENVVIWGQHRDRDLPESLDKLKLALKLYESFHPPIVFGDDNVSTSIVLKWLYSHTKCQMPLLLSDRLQRIADIDLSSYFECATSYKNVLRVQGISAEKLKTICEHLRIHFLEKEDPQVYEEIIQILEADERLWN